MNEDSPSMARILKLRAPAALIGIVCLLIWGAAYGSDPSPSHQQAMYGYLYGFTFWGSISIGAFGLMLLQGSIKSAWGNAVVRILEAAGGPAMLLFVFVLFIPLGLPSVGLHAVYPWSNPDYASADKLMKGKEFYLNTPGFWIRTVVVLAIWILFSYLLKRSSQRQDQTLDKKEWGFRANLGSPGIVMFFLTAITISTDWLMSLQPHYFSTIYPIIWGVGCALSALSLAVLVVLYNSDSEPYRSIVTPKLTRDFGNMFLALTLLWAYTTLSQFLITWQGNLPLESGYYIRRTGQDLFAGQNHLDWNILSNIVILCQFFIPFFALIAPRVKRVVRNLMWTSAAILITRAFTDYWLIFPDVRFKGFGESLGHWPDYFAFFGIGGIWFALFVWQLTKAPLLPKYDTRLMEVEHA